MKQKNERETVSRPWPVLAFAILVLATGLLQLIFVPRAASQPGPAAATGERPQQVANGSSH